MKYRIGDFTFEICAKEGLEFPEHFQLFQTDAGAETDVVYRLEIVDQLPEIEGECISQRPDIRFLKRMDWNPEGSALWNAGGICVYQEISGKRFTVSCTKTSCICCQQIRSCILVCAGKADDRQTVCNSALFCSENGKSGDATQRSQWDWKIDPCGSLGKI